MKWFGIETEDHLGGKTAFFVYAANLAEGVRLLPGMKITRTYESEEEATDDFYMGDVAYVDGCSDVDAFDEELYHTPLINWAGNYPDRIPGYTVLMVKSLGERMKFE